jgi:cytochrome c oxidase subunit I+III
MTDDPSTPRSEHQVPAVVDQPGRAAALHDPQDDPAVRRAQEERLLAAWKTPEGWRYWSAVNNSEVGKWYLCSALSFFLFAGVLALMMRVQLAVPGNDFISPDLYNQAMTLHGSIMMFLFAVPVFEAVTIILLPELLGCRDLPFPRLSAFGFWCFLVGGIFVSGSIFFNAAPAGGWFMYPPLSTDTAQAGIGADIWLLGLSFIEIASIAAAVELIVGVLKCRPPGMRLNMMPLYAWYVLVVGFMIVFAFPPLIAGDLLFELQRAFDWPFFDTARGGDPILWQHLFWIFGHPEVYIIFLPSIALLAMIVPTFGQTPIFGYTWIVLSAVGTGFISFGLWAHHMYTTGMPSLSLGYFSAASTAVAIPTGVQIFALLATTMAGNMRMATPMLFGAGALAIFVLGGLTGVMVALAPFDWQAHDTYFIVAHLHYVIIGGVVFPLIAGIYYYYPLIRGRMLSPRLGAWAFWLTFAGFNIAFLPMHLTGMRGMPRRVATYPEGIGFDWLNMISTVGAFILAAGFAVILFDIIRPSRFKQKATRNPWNAGTLEWISQQPSRPWGSRSVPLVKSRYPLWDDPDFVQKIDEGRFYLNDTPDRLRETLITSVIDAEPIQCIKLPGPTWLTICAALALGGLFILGTFKLYVAAAISGLIALGFILTWLWTGTGRPHPQRQRDIGLGLTVPTRAAGPRSPSWWATFVTLSAMFVAFISLMFSYIYFWSIADVFPPPRAPELSLAWVFAAGLATGLAWTATLISRRFVSRDQQLAAQLTLAAAALSAAGAIALLLATPWFAGLDPTRHAYEAAVWVLFGWCAGHVAVGVIMQLFTIARSIAGIMTADNTVDIANTALFWHFTLATIALALMLTGGFPSLVQAGGGA